MSIIYSSLYLSTNIIGPIAYMIYTQIKSLAFLNRKSSLCLNNPDKQETQNTGNLESHAKKTQQKDHESVYRCDYGKWTMLIVAVLLFNILYRIFAKSLTVILIGLLVKAFILWAPQSIVLFSYNPLQTNTLESLIQKLHLQVHVEYFKSKLIDLFFDVTQRLSFFIIFYQIQEKDERITVLNRMKDGVSRIELQLQENEEIKNRSFIVAFKKMQSLLTTKKCKAFENIGVNCDILKSSEVGKQLLRILQEKTLSRQKSFQNPTGSHSKIQQPTKDNFVKINESTSQLKQLPKSTIIQPSRSESLQEKIDKIRNTVNVPTSEKKKVNQVRVKEAPFTIKRSQTNIDQEFESQSPSPQRTRENRHIAWNRNTNITQTQKAIGRRELQQQNHFSQITPQYSVTERIYEEIGSSQITNPQNLGIVDIVQSERSQNMRSMGSKDLGSLVKILEAEETVLKGSGDYISSNIIEYPNSSPHIFPPQTNISSIDIHPTIHPFKVNLSSLSNPLIMSNTLTTKANILPNSLATSNEYQMLTSSKQLNQISNINIEPQMLPRNQLSNVSQVHTEIVNTMEPFSQESSIPNKHEMSINESEYSDMFDSNGQQEEEQEKLEVKVEAVVENQRENGLKPRSDICYIELYDNGKVRFLSVYDKPMFGGMDGKLVKMYKKPDNFYELVIRENQSSTKGIKKKQGQEQAIDQTEKQIRRKVKFRGQARHFMKYLQKVV